MKQGPTSPDGEPHLPEGFMTLQQYAEANRLPDSEAEFLIRAAADEVNRFNEELGKEVPDIEAPPPIHKYVQESPEGAPTLYFDASRLGELMGQVHEDMRRFSNADET
ncbi:MAG TPA: hypothetical protein VF733_04510 [Candidatus Saccharimonadales bacterium]